MSEKSDNTQMRLKAVKEIVGRMNEREIKPPFMINTGRIQKPLRKIPQDIDFETKDGNTTFEVVGHFNPDGEEFFINQIIRKLGYKYEEYE